MVKIGLHVAVYLIGLCVIGIESLCSSDEVEYSEDLKRVVCNCKNDSLSYDPNVDRCLLNKGFNETCHQTSEEMCNPNIAALTCVNGTCVCKEPGTWDPNRSKCINQEFCQDLYMHLFYHEALGKCILAVGGLVSKKEKFDLDCPQNASLTKWGSGDIHYCKCKDNFQTGTHNKYCLEKMSMGEQCDAHHGDPCDASLDLTCLPSGTCGCDKDLGRIWDSAQSRCRLEVGRRCVESNDCFSGTYCDTGRTGYIKTCKCYEWHEEEAGKCYTKYNQACDATDECFPGLSCVVGRCRCPDPILQSYDPLLKKCRRSAGSPCNSGLGLCTEKAECVEGICKCEFGFESDFEGRCIHTGAYGLNCTGPDCDSKQGLACSSGVCTCISPTLEFVAGKGCTAGIGGPCGIMKPFEPCNEESRKSCDFFVRCEDKASCKQKMCENFGCSHGERAIIPGRCRLNTSSTGRLEDVAGSPTP